MLPTGYANGAKKTKTNYSPKPEPIKLGTSRQTYANRPPTKRMDNWSWKMVIHSDDVEKSSVSLGILAKTKQRIEFFKIIWLYFEKE